MTVDEYIFESELDLIVLSYLPIREALDLTEYNHPLQHKLVNNYFVNSNSLNTFLELGRLDLIKILLDKNIGIFDPIDREELIIISDLIRKNTKLKNLIIRTIPDNGNLEYLFDALLENQSIVSLKIFSDPVKITEEEIHKLIILLNTKNYEELYLSEIIRSCKHKIIRHICRIINLNYIKVLSLDNNYLQDREIKTLSNALKDNSSLTSINFSSNFIADEGAKFIAEVLKVNSTLTSINLGSNCMKTQGFESIILALKTNSSLKLINLCGINGKNEIKRAELIADLLNTNTSLTSINLTRNYLEDQGIKLVAEALKKNNTLQSINLYTNNIREKGIESLAEALKINRSLTCINLIGNSFPVLGLESIAEALKFNTTLTDISLNHNFMETELWEFISKKLESNLTNLSKIN